VGFESPLTSDDFGPVGDAALKEVAALGCLTQEGRPNQLATRMNEKTETRDTGIALFAHTCMGAINLEGLSLS
jgi:hypothetical protein